MNVNKLFFNHDKWAIYIHVNNYNVDMNRTRSECMETLK